MSTGVDYTYRYAYASSLDRLATGANLNLATCTNRQERPYFFDGKMRRPRVVADMLLVLSQVVRTHFFQRRPPLMDPVLTSSESILRIEGFSGCCGVYVRADLPADVFEAEFQGRGTTNVDFNDPMRAALTRIQETDDVRLSVGRDEVALSRSEDRVVEKKVKLPVRWIKGFSEVQAYQPKLSLVHEIYAANALHFFRTVPGTGMPKRPSYVVEAGNSLRLSQREKPGAVYLHGTHRIKVLEPLLAKAEKLRVWSDDETGISAWEVIYDVGRFFLMISPETHRGFSGEGQMLEVLASGAGQKFAPFVRAKLNWQAHIDHTSVAAELNTDPDNVAAALAVLGARGLAGYDVSESCYFHRELPFDIELVELLQPRLKTARTLLEEDKITLLRKHGDGGVDLLVEGSGVSHVVRLRPENDRCTCRWFSRYQGKRGPCKHILGARLWMEQRS